MSNNATAIRLRPAEKEAVNAALVKHRQRTGKSTRIADVFRAGCASFCAAEGVTWPAVPAKEGE